MKKDHGVDCRMIREKDNGDTENNLQFVQHISWDDLKKTKPCSRFVLHILTTKQQQRMSRAKGLLEIIENDFVGSIVTVDES